ncbi:MAG: hypothetical protein QOJ13_1598 [Gaiellales bacterium]|jgi:hypothetical protein|nr:hypothetical protein [Gaiellales bacterium]
MQRNGNSPSRFAEREVRGVADDGRAEVVTIWIERRSGAVWAVGRAVGLTERPDGAVRADDYIFEGYEMSDALEAANEAVTSDLDVSREDGHVGDVHPFTDRELLRPLERWFFGRSDT